MKWYHKLILIIVAALAVSAFGDTATQIVWGRGVPTNADASAVQKQPKYGKSTAPAEAWWMP